MDKNKEEVYIAGIICLLIFLVSLTFLANFTITSGWNIAILPLWVLSGASGVFGVGSFLKPDSFGVLVLKLIAAFAEGQEEGSSSHNEQTQKRTSDSVQIMTHDDTRINIHQKSKGEEDSKNSKIFSCLKGHGNTVHPPDDNHPKASSEEEYAKEHALGTVITREYTCKEEGCGSKFTLYWYQEKSGAGYFLMGK